MDAIQARVLAAIELSELTIAMQRQVIARRHPDEDDAAIEARLREWLLHAGSWPEPARTHERRS